MNLFDLLTRKNGIADYSQNMRPLQAQPQMKAGQVDANGAPITGIEIQPESKITVGDRITNALLGTSAKPVDSINVNNALFMALTNQQDEWRKKGLPENIIVGAGQGLNSGNKDVATFIDNNNIRKPHTDEEIALAKEGKFNSYAPIQATVSENPRVGGLLNDIASGYRENRNTPFSIQNLEPNKNKGIGYRIGEGLGSAVRFGESPAGRALLVGGILGATGGDALQSITYGTSTGMQNQANRMNDKIYRNDLINTQQQALKNSPEFNKLSEAEQKQILDQLHTDSNYMGLSKKETKGLNTEQYRAKLREKQTNMKNKAIEDYLTGRQSQQLQDIADKVNSYRGYLGEKTYGNLIKSQQLRDNAADRKMFYDAQQANLREQMEFRRQQALADLNYKNMMLELQKQKEERDRAYQNAQLGLGYAKLESDNENRRLDRAERAKDRASKILSKQEDFTDVEKQLNNFKGTFKGLPGKAESYTFGNLRAATGTQTTKEANFNAQRTLLFNQIARKLGGEKGVLSDQDMKRIELALPTLTDSYDQKIAKMKAVEDLLTIRKGGTPQTYKSGKYTVRIK